MPSPSYALRRYPLHLLLLALVCIYLTIYTSHRYQPERTLDYLESPGYESLLHPSGEMTDSSSLHPQNNRPSFPRKPRPFALPWSKPKKPPPPAPRPPTQLRWPGYSAQEQQAKDWEYARSLIYSGTGARIDRFLAKAMGGEGVVVSVIGGSVSKGRGLSEVVGGTQNHRPPGYPTPDHTHPKRSPSLRSPIPASHFPIPPPPLSRDLYNPLNLHAQIFHHLNASFPAAPGGRGNRFVNGAQGGVGSDYFSGCWKEHIPEDSDLVLVELGINDARDISVMETYEALLRSLLEMKTQPAIINIQTFTLLFPHLSQSSSLHIDVAAYYDTPVLSLRDVILPRILDDLQDSSRGTSERTGEVRKWFRGVEGASEGDRKVVGGVDLMHISQKGHALISEMVIHYLTLSASRVAHQLGLPAGLGAEGDAGVFGSAEEMVGVLGGRIRVPGMLLAGQYVPGRTMHRSDPTCSSTNSALEERKLSVRDPKSGWREWAWGEKRYLIADTPGSRMTYGFTIREPEQMVEHVVVEVDSEAQEDDEGYTATGPRRVGLRKREVVLAPGGEEEEYEEEEEDEEEEVIDGFIQIAYQRSFSYGLGSVDCWVEGEGEGLGRGTGVRVDGWWDIEERNMGVVKTIRNDLAPGKYTLLCELVKETKDPKGGMEFRLIAVMYD